MDVIIAVPDCDPADGLVFLTVGRQPGTMHDLVRDGRPFVVGQHPVTGSGAHRAVPDRPRVAPLAQSGLRLLQQPGQRGEVPPSVRPQRRFKAGGMTPPRDDMGIGMFLPAAGTEQVIQQRFDVLPARGADLPDHPVTAATAASLTQGLAYGVGNRVDVVGAADDPGGVAGQVPGGLPGGVQLRDRLVDVCADAADQPGRAHQFDQRPPERLRVVKGAAVRGGGQHRLGDVRPAARRSPGRCFG